MTSWRNLKRLGAGFILAPILAAPGSAQQRWQRTYGDTLDIYPYAIQQTTDGGYVVTGEGGPGDGDVYLLKIDSLGDTLWTRHYGGIGEEVGLSVQQTSDGGYIVAGRAQKIPAGDYDAWLIKTDANGDTLWTRYYGGPYDDAANSVRQTRDGGYIVAGTTDSFGPGHGLLLMKTDAMGETLWTRLYGGGQFAIGYSVWPTSDSGYIVAGTSPAFAYLVKTDAAGDTLWTRVYSQTFTSSAFSVRQTEDGGYIVAGYAQLLGAPSFDVYLIRTDPQGDTMWTRTYGGAQNDFAWSAQPTEDGGYVIAGETYSFGAGHFDAWLIKTNAGGDTVWTRTFGGAEDDGARAVQQTTDGGYILAGSTYSFGGPDSKAWLIKTDSLGNTAPYGVSERQAPSAQTPPSLTLSANPSLFTRSTSLSYSLPGDPKSARLEIRDITGRLVRSFAIPHSALRTPHCLTWDGTGNNGQRLPAGC